MKNLDKFPRLTQDELVDVTGGAIIIDPYFWGTRWVMNQIKKHLK